MDFSYNLKNLILGLFQAIFTLKTAICSHLLKKSSTENFIFCVVYAGVTSWKNSEILMHWFFIKLEKLSFGPILSHFRFKNFKKTFILKILFKLILGLSAAITSCKNIRLQMFFNIGVLKSFKYFTGKHLCWSLFLIKLQALKIKGLAGIKKRLQNRCFPVKFLKFLRTPF